MFLACSLLENPLSVNGVGCFFRVRAIYDDRRHAYTAYKAYIFSRTTSRLFFVCSWYVFCGEGPRVLFVSLFFLHVIPLSVNVYHILLFLVCSHPYHITDRTPTFFFPYGEKGRARSWHATHPAGECPFCVEENMPSNSPQYALGLRRKYRPSLIFGERRAAKK